MQITPPFGYREITPFLKNHQVKIPGPGQLPSFTQTLNAIPVSYTEFNVAHRDYPIVFSSGDEGRSFAPVAVLGLQAQENLFVQNHAWTAGVYLPAYVRRYPFCMARVTLDNVEQAERLICVEKDFIAESGGEPMFDAAQAPLPRWKEVEKLLEEYEADLERTKEMCGILADYGLLEPFTMQATLNMGGSMHLTGMFRVDEKKIEFLNASQQKNLIKKGVMSKIYIHLLSLDNFGRLLDRKAGRVSAPEAGAAALSGPAPAEALNAGSEAPKDAPKDAAKPAPEGAAAKPAAAGSTAGSTAGGDKSLKKDKA